LQAQYETKLDPIRITPSQLRPKVRINPGETLDPNHDERNKLKNSARGRDRQEEDESLACLKNYTVLSLSKKYKIVRHQDAGTMTPARHSPRGC
jgi:hypothetical protein